MLRGEDIIITMIIYGDILFTENLIIGSVLFYITSLIHGGTKRTLRIVAGGIMCGLFSFVVFLQQPVYILILMEVVFAFAANAVVFGRRKLALKSMTFLFVTYFAGGITMAVLMLAGSPFTVSPAGVYTPDMKASVLMASVALCVVTARHVIKSVKNYRFIYQQCVEIIINCGGENIITTGFVDTGNGLRDPVGGNAVVIADNRIWQEMQEKGMVCAERFRIIPYESVNAKGTLQAIRTDSVTMCEKEWKNCIVAFNDGVFDLEGPNGCEVGILISRYMIWEGREKC